MREFPRQIVSKGGSFTGPLICSEIPEGRFFASTATTHVIFHGGCGHGSPTEVRTKRCPSGKSTLRYLPANGTPSWGLQFSVLGFKGALQLQKAMENGPFACGEFSKYVFSLTSGRANCPRAGFFSWVAEVRGCLLLKPETRRELLRACAGCGM